MKLIRSATKFSSVLSRSAPWTLPSCCHVGLKDRFALGLSSGWKFIFCSLSKVEELKN